MHIRRSTRRRSCSTSACTRRRLYAPARKNQRRHPTSNWRMGSFNLQPLQEPILLTPWLCFRGGGFPNPGYWVRAQPHQQSSTPRRPGTPQDYSQIQDALERWQAYTPTKRKLRLVWRDTSPQHFLERGGLFNLTTHTPKLSMPCSPIDDMSAGASLAHSRPPPANSRCSRPLP
jgi:hypothetical protein